MLLDENFVKTAVKVCLTKGFFYIKDHRNNNIKLNDGIFTFNDCEQPKTEASIEAIFVEAFKLTRLIEYNEKTFIRKGNKWIERHPEV